jgi:hypothetical protein
MSQYSIWCPVGPADRQRHPPSRTGLADEQPLMHGAPPLEHDREALTEQRVERMGNNDRVQRCNGRGRAGLMTGPLGCPAGQEDERDATELAHRLRRNDLPEAWIAPPEVRELPELVRYRAKLTALRTSSKAQVHAVMAKLGILPTLDDMFGPGGQVLLDQMPFEGVYALRVESLRDLMEVYNRELALVERELRAVLKDHPGYRAIQAIKGVGPIMAAIFVAEIGDVTRFPGRWCCPAGPRCA